MQIERTFTPLGGRGRTCDRVDCNKSTFLTVLVFGNGRVVRTCDDHLEEAKQKIREATEEDFK